MKIAIKKLNNRAKLPSYQTTGSAGLDLMACVSKPIVIAPHERALIPTGLAIALPQGYEAQIRGRSSLALKYGVMPANGVGTIDADYRGEIGVILLNSSNEPFKVEPDMRIAQMVVMNYQTVQWSVHDELDETERGKGGYGSTGI